MKPLFDTFVTCLLWWLMAGSLVWLYIEHLGVVRSVYLARCESERTAALARLRIVIFSAKVILAWPQFVPVVTRKARWRVKCWAVSFWRGERF